jgi:hypothetical protein
LRRTQRRRASTAETSGGCRWELCSGEPAARAGQQASEGAIWGPSGDSRSTCWRCQQPEGRALHVASPAGRRLCRGSAPVREGKRWMGLYSRARLRSRFASAQSSQGRGMGEDGWRRARGRRANGVWRWRSPASGDLPRGTDHGPTRVTHREGEGAAHGPADAGRPRRACTACGPRGKNAAVRTAWRGACVPAFRHRTVQHTPV